MDTLVSVAQNIERQVWNKIALGFIKLELVGGQVEMEPLVAKGLSRNVDFMDTII